MNRLIVHLLENLFLDFQGDLTLEDVRSFLKDDNSPEARALLSKVVADKGVSDMMIALADCLREHIRTGINEDVFRSEIRTYSDS